MIGSTYTWNSRCLADYLTKQFCGAHPAMFMNHQSARRVYKLTIQLWVRRRGNSVSQNPNKPNQKLLSLKTLSRRSTKHFPSKSHTINKMKHKNQYTKRQYKYYCTIKEIGKPRENLDDFKSWTRSSTINIFIYIYIYIFLGIDQAGKPKGRV